MELTIKVTLKPEVKLGDYKELHVEKEAVEVTDEAVEEQVQGLRSRHAKMTANRSAAAKAKAILWKLVPTPLSPALKTSL